MYLGRGRERGREEEGGEREGGERDEESVGKRDGED